MADSAYDEGQRGPIFDDITERNGTESARRAIEARQAFLLQLSDAFRPLTDPSEIQGAAN